MSLVPENYLINPDEEQEEEEEDKYLKKNVS